jgi:hypothetical protein
VNSHLRLKTLFSGHPAQVHLSSLVASLREPIEPMESIFSCLVSKRQFLFLKTSIRNLCIKVGRLTNLEMNSMKADSAG